MRTIVAYIISALLILALFIAIPPLGCIVLATGKVNMVGNVVVALMLAVIPTHIYYMETHNA